MEMKREKRKTERGNRERDNRYKLRCKATEKRLKARLDETQTNSVESSHIHIY